MAEGMQQTRTGSAVPDEEGFIQDFVRAVGQIPYVRKVLIDHSEGHLQTWAVLDAEPWDHTLWYPVLDTELACARRYAGIVAGARLLNVTEYGWKRIREMLPPTGRIVFER